MTYKLKDEEDILEDNLRFHVAQGVDFFIATDNGSQDGTTDILRRYAEAGLLHLIEEPSEDYQRLHGDWVTRMARLASTDFGGDWVVHNDADEFLWPLGGTLHEAFSAIPEAYSVLNLPRPEFVPRPDSPGHWSQRLVHRDAISRVRHKVAHRAAPDVIIGGGSHKLPMDSEQQGGRPARSSRAVLRAVADDDGSAEPSRWVPAPRWPVRILHFPLRSFEHYRRRVELTLFHGGFKILDRRRDLLAAFEAGRLPELYARVAWDDEAVRDGLARGRLVQDTSVRDFLAGCPDPLSDGVPAARAYAAEAMTMPADRLAAEEGANALDMMHALTRSELSLRQQRAESAQRARRFKQEAQAVREELESLRSGSPEAAQSPGGEGAMSRMARALRRP
jgi:hypothetical protein